MFYALFHTMVMVLYALVSGDYQTLNTFRILGLQLFFPEIDRSLPSFIISQIIPICAFAYIYFRLTKKT
jgi:hypothetical protein